MKFRRDFVTNSSSSSYIICFARIDDEEKAKATLEEFGISPLTKDDVDAAKYYGKLGAEWCGAIIYGADDVMNKHPDSKYIIIEDYNDADYDDDGEPIYDYDFSKDAAILSIKEENGFADIEISEGEGRNG